jgi:Na+/melibiose symporter-like transporter
MLLVGVFLDAIGHESGAEHATPEVAQRMFYGAFLGGSVLTLMATLLLRHYPVTRAYMAQIQSELARRSK